MFSPLKKWLCRHEFSYADLALTGIPQPPPPALTDYPGWMKYLPALDKSDWHRKRVRWPCRKCGRVFYAHCGLDIMSLGRPVP